MCGRYLCCAFAVGASWSCVRHFAYGLGSAGLGGALGAGGGAAAARKVENKGGVISWRVCVVCAVLWVRR